MLKGKRGQGMPVNIIIIAAIALIVLFVLAAIFTGRTRIFAQDLQSCAAKQGQCLSNCPPNNAFIANTDCPELFKKKTAPGEKCCVQVYS